MTALLWGSHPSGVNPSPRDILPWQIAKELHLGDLLLSHDGQLIPIEKASDSGEILTVYNLTVEEYHTYFVGDWGWNVWAHNETCAKAVWEALKKEGIEVLDTKENAETLKRIADHINAGNQNEARQLLQGLGLSGKKSNSLISVLEKPPISSTPVSAPTLVGPEIPTLEQRLLPEIRGGLALPRAKDAEIIQIIDSGSKVAKVDPLLPDALAQQRKMIVRIRIPADPANPNSVAREINISVGRGLESGQFGTIKPSSGQ